MLFSKAGLFFLLPAASAAYQLAASAFGVPGANATFDYVVVGGGTAGLAIATRLAQDGGYSVAVVEAGGFYETSNGNLSVVPGFGTYFSGSNPNDTQPLIDWGFVTTPQAGAANRSMHYARGKALGGSSARNFMVYQRPTTQSMQKWADEVNDQSYTFDQTLKYYEKSVQYFPPNQALYTNTTNNQTSQGFGNGGPLKVSYQNFIPSFTTWAYVVLQRLGLKAIDGFNNGKLIGSGWVTWTVDPKNAQRSSSESSFLQSAIAKSTTIQIYTHTLAQKLLFGPGNVANGVSVTTQSGFGTPPVTYALNARKEVIVSAGAFQSPQLLMVSGIGPAETLRKNGISVVKDLPGVGQNLWDQPFWSVTYRVGLQTTSALLNNAQLFAQSVGAYNNNASGRLSAFGGGYFGWEKLPNDLRRNLSSETRQKLDRFPYDWPEVEYLPIDVYTGYQRNYQTEDPLDGTNYAAVAVSLITPSSRGTVTINSSCMSNPPVINPNWLTDKADKEAAVAILKRQRQVWAELQKLGVTVGQEILPGPNVTTDQQILKYISESMIEIWHPSSTCKMGQQNDSMAVVDSQARVFGVKGLRVVDASIFPFLPPGHPQATVYMIAEKIAAQIIGK